MQIIDFPLFHKDVESIDSVHTHTHWQIFCANVIHFWPELPNGKAAKMVEGVCVSS